MIDAAARKKILAPSEKLDMGKTLVSLKGSVITIFKILKRIQKLSKFLGRVSKFELTTPYHFSDFFRFQI